VARSLYICSEEAGKKSISKEEITMGKIVLNIESVSFSYDAVDVLEKVSFKVEQGDFVGIIGPNGSGKSTLLKCLSRVLDVKAGDIRLYDKPISEYRRKELARNMAVVSQDTDVSFGFTCEEIVFMGRSPYLGRFSSETETDHAIVRNAMQLTNTEHLAKRVVTEISGGERQRVFIAQALAQQPRVLLLDEPTSHLDIKHQAEILDLIAELNERDGLTVIAVMHDLNLAALYCDHLIMLREGQVYSIGDAHEVITAQNIEEVYGAKVLVTTHPVAQKPQVVVMSQKAMTLKQNGNTEQYQANEENRRACSNG